VSDNSPRERAEAFQRDIDRMRDRVEAELDEAVREARNEAYLSAADRLRAAIAEMMRSGATVQDIEDEVEDAIRQAEP
jgi:hypothetical protein